MRKTLGSVAVMSGLLGVLGILGCDRQSTTGTEYIDIAVVSSESGDLAEIGKDMSRGAILAIEEANANGGIGGKQIKYHTYDDQGNKNSATNVASLVCQDKNIVGVIGHLTSGCTKAAGPIYTQAGMAVIMPVPTNPDITMAGARNLFRIPPTDDQQAPFLARFLLARDPGASVAVVHDLTDYGVGFATAFRKTFEAGGGKVVTFEGEQKESRDFRTLITKLRELTPKYVVLGATYDMGAPFVRRMRELDLKAIALAGDGCFGTEFLKQTAEAGEGTIMSFIAPDRSASPLTERFFAAFESKYGKVVSFAPLGYDAAQVLMKAIRDSQTPTRLAVLATLQNREFSLNGVTGKIQFGDNGDNLNKNLSLYTIQGGRYVLLTP